MICVWSFADAQIDHLVIHRTHKFYVLETKSFSHGLKITDEGEFLSWNDWKKTYDGMASPIEQNRRHAEVLRDVLESLGYSNPEIESFVLISPNARIDRSKLHSCPEVMKADQFTTAFKKRLLASLNSVGEIIGGFSKAIFGDSAGAIAEKLVRLHKPITFDYEAKFGMRGVPAGAGEIQPAQVVVAPQASVQRVTERATTVEANSESVSAGPTCKSCGSGRLSIEYGKFGYYFKCKACAGTPH
jgi:hypothetical protein